MPKEAVRRARREAEDRALREKAEAKKGEKKEEVFEAPPSGETSFSDLLGGIKKLNEKTEELKRKNAARLGFAQPAVDGPTIFSPEDEDDLVSRPTDEPAAKPTGVKPASESHATPRPAQPHSDRESINAMYAHYMDSKDEDIRELQEVVQGLNRQVDDLKGTVSDLIGTVRTDLIGTVRTQAKEIAALKQENAALKREQEAAAKAISEMMEVIKKTLG